jgi:hypothetical protein
MEKNKQNVLKIYPLGTIVQFCVEKELRGIITAVLFDGGIKYDIDYISDGKITQKWCKEYEFKVVKNKKINLGFETK